MPDELFNILDIDREMGMDDQLKSDETFLRLCKRGRLIKEASIRKSVIDLAIGGSSPAQAAALIMIEQSKINEISI